MRNIFETAETFAAASTIEAGLFMLKEIRNQPITDKGDAKRAIEILKDMIEAKKVLQDSYEHELKCIGQIETLL